MTGRSKQGKLLSAGGYARGHTKEFLEAFFKAEEEGDLKGLEEWKDPEETIRYKVEIALPEVSVAEVEAADARMVQAQAASWTELWRNFPGSWQGIYEAPAKLGYDLQKYDFLTLLRDMLECPPDVPLEKLHEVERPEDFEPCQPLHLGMTLAGLLPPASRLKKKNHCRSQWRSSETRIDFLELYRRFLKEEILPKLAEAVGYTGDFCAAVQSEPVIRVVMPGHRATKAHRDQHYGHIPEEINFWLPITSVAGSNSLFVESFPGREDFQAFEGENGVIFRWWGNLCEHYAEPNCSGNTRVSLDFRIVPGRFWAAALASGSVSEAERKRRHYHGGSLASIGSYYTWISGS